MSLYHIEGFEGPTWVIGDPVGPPRRKGAEPTFDSVRQCIASAAHLRGVVIIRNERVAGTLDAAELCTTLRAAWMATDTPATAGRHEHVRRLAYGIYVRLGIGGPVHVNATAWSVLKGYAKPRRVTQ